MVFKCIAQPIMVATFGPSGGVPIVTGNQGAFVAVGPDHSVYAFWYAGSNFASA